MTASRADFRALAGASGYTGASGYKDAAGQNGFSGKNGVIFTAIVSNLGSALLRTASPALHEQYASHTKDSQPSTLTAWVSSLIRLGL